MEQLSEFVVNHWILVTAFCAVLGLLLANLLGGAGGVGTQEAVKLINRSGAVVVDVRAPAEFNTGHIIDAINIPSAELGDAVDRLRQYGDAPLLVCCASGNSSTAAVRKLRQAGLTQARSLSGGLAAWRQDNLPVTTD
ncbi:MAG: rhodanese-like domain-containing protein [Gammaproteobacteria bacterium]